MPIVESSQLLRLEQAWTRWTMQSARVWEDVSGIVHKVGIPVVDEDHKVFTQYALDLNLVVQALSHRDISLANLYKGEEIFEKLFNYADSHFKREMQMMQSMQSPMFSEHVEQHAIFLEMLEGYHTDFKSGRLQMVAGLKLSILDWWVKHINSMDYQTFVIGNTTQAQLRL